MKAQWVAERASKLADRLVGDRVRMSLDRRIRAQLRARAADDARQQSGLLTSPRFLGLVADEVARQLADADVRQQESPAELARISRDFTADVFFAAGGRFTRRLTPQRYETLAAEIRILSGREDVDWPMLQAFRSIVDHEARGLGRVAGSTYNIMGKLVLPPLLRPPAGPVLEIGTLFGLFAPALLRQFRRVGEFRSLTVLDPFAGTQIQPGAPGTPDPTGTPVSADVAWRNLVECGLRPSEVTLLTGFSTDPEVQAQAAENQPYAVVVVDGDHSESGVYEDLWWVEKIVAPGGVVVMDDFGDRSWPGVEIAGRRYLADGGVLELLGTASTSAYLRMPVASSNG